MLNIIVACDINNAIGYQNELLCKLKDDMKHFKEVTTEKLVVMGRKTWESIGSKPLPNRVNIVMSRELEIDSSQFDTTVYVSDRMEEIITVSKVVDVFVIGGEEIYRMFLPYADRVIMTKIHHEFKNADTWFPFYDFSEWESDLNDFSFYHKDDRNEYPFSIHVLDKPIEQGEL